MGISTEAVIEIGSTGIRILVANIMNGGTYEILDKADKPVSLGRDVFTSGFVSRDSILECIAVLGGFREILLSYGIEPGNVRVVGTSALREAENRDSVIDRIAMRTGFSVDVIEAVEESHYQYLAVQEALFDAPQLINRFNSMIMEVGGGSTELMLLRRGKIVAAHSLRLGTIRIDEQTRAAMGFSSHIMRYLHDNVNTACDNLNDDLLLSGIKSFVVMGSDARFAARMIGEKKGDSFSIIPRISFFDLVDRLKAFSIDGLVREFSIPYSEAESLMPGLVIMAMFFERLGAADIIVPDVSLRDGILIALAKGSDENFEEKMHTQTVASAIGLGRRFHFDEAHASRVAENSLFLFDKLIEMHRLKKRDRLLLEVASYVHDVGTYIRSSGHHRHSEYIILNSELFGIQQNEQLIISNLVRYHRRSGPVPSHPSYISLSREDRARVFKLSSLLRIAEGLDRGHTQRFKLVTVEIKEDHVLLQTDCQNDLTLERIALADKSDMFEEVFGLKVVII